MIDHENILHCMERHDQRYRAMTMFSTHPSDTALRLREWFEARMDYLTEEYRRAINAADNIIGRQWLFDARPKLPPP